MSTGLIADLGASVEEEKVNILLVDDHRENLLAMEAILGSLGQNVVKATSGQDALRWLLREEFAVILLDVQMPDMDGFECASLIRGREKTSLTPILFVTAIHRSDLHVNRGYSLGAVDYLFKPIVPEILRAKVGVFVDLHLKTRQVQHQAERLRQIEQRQHEMRVAEMAERNRQIQEASRLKTEFLANMSHELRTPLNAILGFADLIHDGLVPPDSPKFKEYVGHIVNSSVRMLKLINEGLDLLKIESGKMEFRPEPVDPGRLVKDVIDIVGSLASRKRIQLTREVHPAVSGLRVDPEKLQQVLYNFLANAVKFTPDGGRVLVRLLPEGDHGFRIEVEDTGIGVREEDLNRLFVEFQQIHCSHLPNPDGTGLGLALTRRIVEAQGGRVGARSVYGKGSVFYAVLPRSFRKIECRPAAEATGAEVQALPTLDVLPGLPGHDAAHREAV
jgi:signal transduction histidine kinase